MAVSQKCQYALRAIFELGLHCGGSPQKIAAVAEAQAIPVRFLEQILSQLRHAGFVESRRGNGGGYLLARSPQDLTVGEVIRFVEGPIGPVQCVTTSNACPRKEECVFLPMWQKAQHAVAEVYDNTTFQSLMDQRMRMHNGAALTYAI